MSNGYSGLIPRGVNELEFEGDHSPLSARTHFLQLRVTKPGKFLPLSLRIHYTHSLYDLIFPAT
jgi:hypothetical protein